MKLNNLLITMPCFNEEDGIGIFLAELMEHFCGIEFDILVIDDRSTDGTLRVLKSLTKEILTLKVLSNEVNLGHGRTTLRGLQYGVSNKFSFILALDGDGQFIGSEVRNAFNSFLEKDVEILEGVRRYRTDPFFRVPVTFLVRLLVLAKSGKLPMDGNTPFRIYKSSALSQVLSKIPPMSSVPNIHISIFTRVLGYRYLQIPVRSIERRGLGGSGSTWGKSKKILPNKKFIDFCLKSAREFL
jgi:glycosyltransferase involved in cell wall biosynthesis